MLTLDYRTKTFDLYPGNDAHGPFLHFITTVCCFSHTYGHRWLTRSVTGLLINCSIASYLTGSALVPLGLTWWQAIIAIVVGNILATIAILLNSLPGGEYHRELLLSTRLGRLAI